MGKDKGGGSHEIGRLDERVLVFGGPYGNLAATRALRARTGELGIGPARVICTGDLVAYCAEPAETIDEIRAWGIHVVMGNCEEALAASEPDCGCGFESGSACSALAETWYRFADRRVGAGQRRWMQSLPRALDFEIGGLRFRVVHGSPDRINEFVFASSDAGAKRAWLADAGVDAIVGGHAGIPFGQALGNGHWLNAGVIGLPANDGGAHVWYLLIEARDSALEIGWQRLDYDHAASQASTRAAGMTEYAEALVSGLWPSLDILPAAERARAGRPLDLPPLRIPLRQGKSTEVSARK